MKPKQTQVLGLLITVLLSLIVYNLYIIYSLTSYIKLDQSDVTTSFAIVDAIFFQVIKLIIVSYLIFALSVEIRGIYILRDRLKNKILARLKSEHLIKDEPEIKEGDYIRGNNKDITNQFTLQDLASEIKIQDDSTKLNFTPVSGYDKRLVERYGRDALESITRADYLNLSVLNIEAKLSSLKLLEEYYDTLNLTKSTDKNLIYWKNCLDDIKSLKCMSK